MLRCVELTDNRNGVFSSDKNIKFITSSNLVMHTYLLKELYHMAAPGV